MSFSSEVREELGRHYSKGRHCQIAELAAMFLMGGSIAKNPLTIEFQTDNMVLAEKYGALMRRVFAIDVGEPVSAGDTLRVLGAFKLLTDEGAREPQEIIGNRRCNMLLLQKSCCRRAFIRGAFMAAGSISDPSKSYHMEIVCRTMEQADQLRELMGGFGAQARIVERKNHFVVYLKEGEQIVDMLNVMEAHTSLMDLENVRILKEMRNSVNRRVNCETANIGKTVSAAVKQVEDITLIRDYMGFDRLPPQLREMALLRLEYQDAPLKELGNYLDPPVGKSGVNHRLRKLSGIAAKIRDGSIS